MGRWTCLPHQVNFPSRNPLLSSVSIPNIIIFSEDSFAFLLKLVPEIGPNLSCYNRCDLTLFFSYPFHHRLGFLTLSNRLPYNKRFCKMTPKENSSCSKASTLPLPDALQQSASYHPATPPPLLTVHGHACCLLQPDNPWPYSCHSSGSSTSLGRMGRRNNSCLLPCLCRMCCRSGTLTAHI